MRAELKTRLLRKTSLRALALAGVGASMLLSRDAGAQSSSTQKPMPNVLLLVDTSGSMERMTDNSLPSANNGVPVGGLPNACSPGVESNPNRWGMLTQALTGNMQPFFSCAAVDRSSAGTGAAFRNEYKIAGVNPYDTDYVLPYHRPLTGALANASTCAIGPSKLPGATTGTSGVGPSLAGYAAAAGFGGDVRDFPDDALVSAKWPYMQTQYAGNSALGALGANACIFDQAPDGQLDAARDYVRFALMTFDNDVNKSIGVNSETWPPQGAVNTGGGLPFLGQWSYRRDPANNPNYNSAFSVNGSSEGLPIACAPPNLPFEVGARHWGAPPWEGRMVEFPAEDATLYDIQRTNERIQKVLLSTRPFGATPIDGMMDDARDYFLYNARGPVQTDAYVRTAQCREQYIVLLTDGAPNLDLRPSCVGGICPFPDTAATTAASLYADPTKRVTTFVIGFSVNGTTPSGGDGFPSPYNAPGSNNCKSWYNGVGGTPTAMAAACGSPVPAVGTTAEACCALNKIAYEGTGGAAAPVTAPAVGPFFAESQADIVLAFGRILASITKSVSTRTVPTFTPAVYASTGFGVGATTAQYIGSFIPNAQKPWSGEILRERSTCTGTPLLPVAQTPAVGAGDSMAVNLAAQTAANRLFVSFVPDIYVASAPVGTPPSTNVVDAARSVRPFAASTDGVPAYTGTERSAPDWGLTGAADIKLALDIDRTTCKRGRAASGGPTGTVQIPALDQDAGDACSRVVMGFTTGHVGAITETGTIPGGGLTSYDFNIRCKTAGGLASVGKCSITGVNCDVSNPTACAPLAGQVCVPDCAPLGAIFRANPIVNGPPDALLRDAGYRAFQARRNIRKPTLFAATTDGILHAFKAVEQTAGAHHELWSFIPPAILPRLAANYPAGNQILLDGSPIVRDTVWERSPGDLDTGGATSPGAKWHTTLVAGLGSEGGGYYSVNVTDSDCNSAIGTTTGECVTATASAGYQSPTKGNLDDAGRGDYDTGGSLAKRGPHFLWQLTDVPKNSGSDPALVVRRTKDGVDMVSLFGRQTGTPAITTLQVTLAGSDKQVGVAILPGGVNGPPIAGLNCARTVTASDVVADTAHLPRPNVRRWAQNCTGANSAVPGRGVTIVRLDNGQILRHFGRQQDVPQSIWNAGIVTPTPFDAPVVGTPVVYPQTTGAVGQKVFVGDADGTLWRIDVSSNDPTKWKVQLFADLFAAGGSTAADSQPIANAPIIALDPGGSLIVNVATGDQENVIYKSGQKNFVWSIRELRPTSTSPPTAEVLWYESFTDGERVTGPMTVFDRTLYFATFAPQVPAAGVCEEAGRANLWGLNYYVPDAGGKTSGGLPMWCSSVLATGVCNSASLVKKEPVPIAGYLIPGVTLRATQACSDLGNLGEGLGTTGFQSLSQSQFSLTYGVPKGRAPATGLPPSAMTNASARPLPRVATTVNAWALITD